MAEPIPLTITLPEQYELTELRDGTVFPIHVDVLVREGTEGPLFEMVFDVEDGKPVLSRFTVGRAEGDPPLTAGTIHEVRVGALVESTIHHIAAGAAFFAGRARTRAEIWAAGESATDVARRRPVTDALLHQVANIYSANENGAPTRAVADMLFTSHRNATRWVAIARERGFLPPYRSESEEDA